MEATGQVPQSIYVREYGSFVHTAQLLRGERAMLFRVVQFYGPLPCSYREQTGGQPEDDLNRPDVTSLYDAAHARLCEVDEALRSLGHDPRQQVAPARVESEHDCCCDEPHRDRAECEAHLEELRREGARHA